MKYTIVYSERVGINPSFGSTMVMYEKIETENIEEYIAENYPTNIWYCFDGWVKESGLTEDNQ